MIETLLMTLLRVSVVVFISVVIPMWIMDMAEEMELQARTARYMDSTVGDRDD